MHSTMGAFFMAILSASIAAGSVIPAKIGTLQVNQAHNKGFVAKSGPIALARAYNKYGVPISPSLRKAVDAAAKTRSRKRNTGTAIANSDQGDLEYLVEVEIGTPAQKLNLDFDTGSSDLWVFSTETSNAGSHSLYDPSSSSSAQQLQGESWKISYADGSNCSGDVYSDTVTVGGLTVQNQAVESAQQVSQQFASGDSDGLLGLAFSSINTVTPDQQKTWFDNVADQLDSPLFTADLKHNTPGSYLFGAVPSEAQSVNYVPVDNSRGYWGFTAGVDNSEVDGIADTGTTLLLLDDQYVDAYYQQIQGATNDPNQGGYVYDCNAQVPDFTFTVGDGSITIPSDLMTYASAGNGQCFGGLQSNGGIGLSIFGDIALKAAYVVFDAGNQQVGWAQK